MHLALTASAESQTSCCKRYHKNTSFLLIFLTISYTVIQNSQIVESKPINFASPLKSLTIRDSTKDELSSPRSNFLVRFKSGIEAERRVRKEILEEAKKRRKFEIDNPELDIDEDEDFFESTKWAEMSAEKFEDFRLENRKKVERAFDEGFSKAVLKTEHSSGSPSPKRKNEYQFIGVVQPGNKNNVKWYARSKPKKSKWSVRVINVDKAALLRDLFVRGKIDIYGEYKNKGIPIIPAGTEVDGEEEVPKRTAVIEADYKVKERSWKTLWNFSPKAFFTDRSGMYWRQRRLAPGVYTDGEKVYETIYHYGEGRNGMKLISENLNSYLDRHPEFQKESLLEKVNGGGKPDVVLEF